MARSAAGGAPRVPDYRLYPLRPDGKIAGAPQEFFATSDEAAITYAGSQAFDHGCEIWERDRFVGKVRTRHSPDGSSP